jgi:hypothetical protein
MNAQSFNAVDYIDRMSAAGYSLVYMDENGKCGGGVWKCYPFRRTRSGVKALHALEASLHAAGDEGMRQLCDELKRRARAAATK